MVWIGWVLQNKLELHRQAEDGQLIYIVVFSFMLQFGAIIN